MKQRMLIYGTLALIASLAIVARSRPQKTVAERLVEYGPAARARLEPHFKKVSLAYPPARLVLVVDYHSGQACSQQLLWASTPVYRKPCLIKNVCKKDALY